MFDDLSEDELRDRIVRPVFGVHDLSKTRGSPLQHREFPPQVHYSSFYRPIWKKVKIGNGNYIIVVLGLPGAGKSWASLRIAYDLMRDSYNRPTFDADNNVCYSLGEFFERVTKTKFKGEVIILDESGIEEALQSRNFMRSENKLGSSLVQTQRFRNQIIIFNLPSAGMLDTQVKSLCHADIIMDEPSEAYSSGIVRVHDPDLWGGDLYRKYLGSKIGGEYWQWPDAIFKAPPKHVLDVYEPMHAEKKKALSLGWKDKLNSKDEKKVIPYDEAFEKVKGLADRFLDGKGRIHPYKIIEYIYKNEEKKRLNVKDARMIAGILEAERA